MNDNAYGLWPLVMLSTLVLLIFAASFFHPKTKRDWRVMGGFSAFAVALFTEMYGFPLTIYLLSSWLGDKVPWLGLSHNDGHLFNDLLGWKGDAHASPVHILSYVLIIAGFWLIAAAWKGLYAAARESRLATDGPYRHVRHPQYAGFLLIMVGFLVQWPTLPTLLMFPVLVLVYRRLAIGEEREVEAELPTEWRRYAAQTPRFVPRLLHAKKPRAQQGGVQ